MKKNIITFLIIICLLIANDHYSKGEKSNCNFKCTSSTIRVDTNANHEGMLPYYPFNMNI